VTDHVLGVDIGTSSTKAVLFDWSGRAVARGEHAYQTSYPQRGWAEQDPQQWWNAFLQAVRQLLEQDAAAGASIAGIGISCQAPTLLPVDRSVEHVRPALIWMDRRAEPQCRALRHTIGEEEMARITANRIDPFYVLPKLLWFRESEPELYGRTDKLLQPNGYIVYRLTGEHSMDRAHASITQLYDVAEERWSDALLQELDISRELLPDIFDGDSVVGSVTPAAAAETGLTQGTPVIAGTVDGAAAAIEAGVVGEGDAVDMTGTSTVLLVSTATRSRNRNLTNMSHGIPGKQLVLAAMSTTGAALSWLRDTLAGSAADAGSGNAPGGELSFQELDQRAERDQPGPSSLLFLPYLAGERSPIWNSEARGALIGMDLNTSQGAIVRALLEGAAYAVRHNVEEIGRSGTRIERMRAVGGGAQSDLWLRIKASVLNMALELPETSLGAPLGNAVLVYGALQQTRAYEDMLQGLVRPKRRIDPVPEWVEEYNRMYGLFRAAYEQLEPLYHGMAKMELARAGIDTEAFERSGRAGEAEG
jgi:xylulokinase